MIKQNIPTRRERFRLRRGTMAGARREVARGNPHERVGRQHDTAESVVVAYQERVAASVDRWLSRVAAVFRPVQEVWQREIQAAGDELGNLLRDLDENAQLIPVRLVTGDLYRRLVPAVVIAELVQVAAMWPLVSDLILPLALLTAVAIATAMAVSAILAGASIGALVFDERGSSHELSPRQRTMWKASAVLFATLTFITVVVVAIVRGDIWLWIPLALVVAAIEMTWGTSLYESRYHRQRESLRRDCAKVIKRGREKCVGHAQAREAALGMGREAVGHGRRILRDGEVEFDRYWRRINWRSADPVPFVPQLQLPGEADLAERLLIPVSAQMQALMAIFDGISPASQLPARVTANRYENQQRSQLPPA